MADVNNPGSEPARSVEGDNPTLDELYDTLGSTYAGLDLRKQEAEEDQRKLLAEERDLIQQREDAAREGDQARFKDLTEQLERLAEAYMVSQSATEESADAGSDQHAQPSGDRRREHGRDGDEPASDGADAGSALPGRGDPGDVQR